MSKRYKILSLVLCFIILWLNFVYADTVIIGAAPSSTDKTVSQSANTTFLQNQYTGPGTLPSSSNNLGTSPLQSGVVDYSSNTPTTANIDANGVSYSGPKTETITSPAVNNAKLATSTGNIAVITNSANDKGTKAENTADAGPSFKEVVAPAANGNHSYKTADGVIANGEITNNNSGPTDSYGASTVDAGIPSYSTGTGQQGVTDANGALNTDIIIYQVNSNIQAVKPNVSAPTALVVNATTRQIYYSKDGFGQYAPSGLANLVTAYLLVSYKGLNDVLTVSASAVTGLESGANTCGLRAGDVITVKDAIGALFVKSCCDVANVVAENVAGSIPNFVNMMNQTAKNFGCVGTVFMNPSGLNNTAQVTNVYDMAIIMDKISAQPTLKPFLLLSNYALPATTYRGTKNLVTSNQLLTPGNKNYYAGIGASRMGYTSKAKYTMASEIDYNGQRLVAVILKANGTQYSDMTKLLNFAKVACVEAGAQGNQITYNTTTTQVAQTTSSTQSISSGDTQGNWKQDSKGWFFVKANGSMANNEWIKQNGKMYCVDSSGYMITGWRQFSNGKFYYFEPGSGEFRHSTWVNISTGAYYLQADGSLATAEKGTTKNIVTSVGTYTIDENGKAIAKVN